MAVTSFRRPPPSRGPGQRSGRLASLAEHFRTDLDWRNRLKFNAFATRNEILNGYAVLEPIGDLHVLQIQEKLQLGGFRGARKETVRDALSLVCGEQTYHPLQDMLIGLRGKAGDTTLLNRWLIECLGCEDSLYVQKIGRMFLIAMVARVMRPGCKADYMLVFEGPQGIQKSEAVRALAGDEYFDDQVPLLDRDPVRVSMALRGKWVFEVAEMDSFRRTSMDTLKAFVTRRVENFTPKYGRGTVAEPRQCLFIGTCNGQFSFREIEGARRFWPVPVTAADPERLAGMREQLLAEAVAAYDAGEQWWPDQAFENEHIKPHQEERREIEPWVEVIGDWLNTNPPGVTLRTAWLKALRGHEADYSREQSLRIANAMRELGWGPGKRTEKVQFWVKNPISC